MDSELGGTEIGGVMTIIDRLLIGILALGIWALVATQLTSTVDAAEMQRGSTSSRPLYVEVTNMYEISLWVD